MCVCAQDQRDRETAFMFTELLTTCCHQIMRGQDGVNNEKELIDQDLRVWVGSNPQVLILVMTAERSWCSVK